MNRLREETAFDPTSERGIELLRSVQPPLPQPEMKRRVWAALQQTTSTAPRLRPGMLRALVLGAGVMVFAATAAAALGGHWIARQVERMRVAPPPVSVAPAIRHEHVRSARALAEVEPPAVEAAPRAPAPVPELRELERPRPHRVAPLPASTPAQERTQVLDAMIALRRDHDARRATALLDTYLAANRHGALREEALVLAVEAADARGDVVRAGRLARTYQAEFPHGRFNGFVQGHVKD